MRFLRLDLIAFGPFTDATLELAGDGPNLHLVYGPNEAGKSSSLRALHQLLYGIPRRSRDGFLHPNPQLRIGARLERHDAAPFDCIRRKGDKKTLRTADDSEELSETLLNELLHGVDADSFRQRFGIDYDELVAGGRAIVRGGGDLGEVLFAAGSGVAGLNAVARRLSEEAAELFAVRGQKPTINAALSELKLQRSAVKEHLVPSAEWAAHDLSLREGEERRDQIERNCAEKEREKRRLELVRQALPLFEERTKTVARLEPVADAPILPEDFSDRRAKALADVEIARHERRDAVRGARRARRALDVLPPLGEWLQRSEKVSEFLEGLGKYRQALADRPGLVTRKKELEEEARKILRVDLGRDPDLGAAEALFLTRAERQTIEDLQDKEGEHTTRRSGAESARRELQGKIKKLTDKLTQLDVNPDPEPLEQATHAARRRGDDLEERLTAARNEIQGAEEQAANDLQRLPQGPETVAELKVLAVPSRETIERFEQETEKAQATLEKADLELATVERELRDAERELEALRREHDVPSEEDLAAARQRRDAAWMLVRRSLDGVAPPAADIAALLEAFSPAATLAEAYRSSVEGADRVADRLRAEAHRVAAKAQLEATRATLTHRFEEGTPKVEAARRGVAECSERWIALWVPLGIEPRSPREMEAWRVRWQGLVQSATDLRQKKIEAEKLEWQVGQHREELARGLKRLGHPKPASDESLFSLLTRCEKLVTELMATRGEREHIRKQIESLEEERLRQLESQRSAEEKAEDWNVAWRQATLALGLGEQATTKQVRASLAAIDDLGEAAEAAAKLGTRLEAIDRETQQFERDLQNLVQALAPELRDEGVEQAAAALDSRRGEARSIQGKRQALLEERARERGKLADARRAHVEARTILVTLCEQAGCASPSELVAAEERAARRKEAEGKLNEIETHLRRLATGVPLEKFLADIVATDLELLPERVDTLDREIERLQEEKSLVAETIGEERSALKRMDGSARAAEAQEEAENLLARLRRDVGQYTRLRLASAVLRRAIERYRDRNQGPVLERASELFERLTLGSFTGLHADYNDKGEAVLMGVRPDGRQRLGVDDMSTGTCDQLYLSLRLASLHHHLEHHPPLPFVVDDILIQFDDQRAAAALEALADLSSKTQVIFFTHHEHLIELAESRLGKDRVAIHRLTDATEAEGEGAPRSNPTPAKLTPSTRTRQ